MKCLPIRRYATWLAILLVGLIGLRHSFSTAIDQATPAQRLHVSTTELAWAYQHSFESAEARFHGKLLAVRGTVSAIAGETSERVRVELSVPRQRIVAELVKERWGANLMLTKGQPVALLCRDAGLSGDTLWLEQCRW